MKKWDPKYVSAGWTDDNYWAGAKKACDDIGMSLPDKSKLESLANKTTAEKEQLGLPTCFCWYFWSSSELYANGAYEVSLGNGDTRNAGKYFSGTRVLCVGDQSQNLTMSNSEVKSEVQQNVSYRGNNKNFKNFYFYVIMFTACNSYEV